MHDWYGVLTSILFTFVIIAIAELLNKKAHLKIESTRKFIHIGVCHWWLIAMFTIDQKHYAIVPPILFTILNFLSYKMKLVKSMERNKGSADLGTVYYALSLLILVWFSWEKYRLLGAIAILILGYGDGFAAVIGAFGKRRFCIWGNSKSLEGSFAMWISSFLISSICLKDASNMWQIAFIIATIATFMELLTPLGLDNLSVPIVSFLVSYLLLFSSYTIQNTLLFNICIGIVVSSLISYKAYTRESLTLDGSIAAIVLTTTIIATAHFFGGLLLLLFFISSSFFSHYKKSAKKEVAEQFDKTGNRDAFQVFANGGMGFILAIAFYITNDFAFLIAYAISFATANADTWATELGVLNKKNPFSLRTFSTVVPGTSGAISLWGSFCAFVGSVFIAIFAAVTFLWMSQPMDFCLKAFAIISIMGFVGAFIDSFLGATVQAIYYNEELKKETERKFYKNKPNKLLRGFRFFNNDLVNFLSIAVASILWMFYT